MHDISKLDSSQGGKLDSSRGDRGGGGGGVTIGPFMPLNFHRNCKAKLGSGRWSILSSSKGGASIPGASASLKVSIMHAQNSNSRMRRCNSYAQVCNQAAAAECRMRGLSRAAAAGNYRDLQGGYHGAQDPMTSA